MGIKVVMALHYLNFCEQVEFEGSNRDKADVLQLAKGQIFAKRIQVGSTFDDETGEWGNLVPDAEGAEPANGAGFTAAWDPVPPIDPQVLAAKEEAQRQLEADREANRLKAEEAQKKAEGEKKEFVMP